MSHPSESIFKTIQLYSTATYPCSYLPQREARSQVAAPSHMIDTDVYSELVEQGFRRSGLFTYRPHCDACNACQPMRVNVGGFSPNRTQRKTWRRHSGLNVQLQELHWEAEHFDLYNRYQKRRHPGAGMDEDSQAQYTQFLLTSRVDSCMAEFRTAKGKLVMVAIIDALKSGLSAVYTFFDPEAPGSLGTYGVLWQIEQCRQMGLPWLYLGYLIEESRKMRYKSQFRPFQVLRNGAWQDVA
jgi:arginine-tRNA-protein transferase